MRYERRTDRGRSNEVESRPPLLWLLVTLVVAISGVVVSTVAASELAGDDELAAEQAFERAASEIANSLSGQIRRQADLVVNTGAVYASDPELTSADLENWFGSIDAIERHPELLAVAAVRNVPSDELSEFTDRLRRDPTFGLGPEDELVIDPPGDRSSYCFLQAAVDIAWPVELPAAGHDYCASSIGPLLAAARDAGTPTYLALPTAGGTQLVVQAPIYAAGSDPGTVADRRLLYIGNLGTAIDPTIVFDSVLSGHPGTTITLSYDGPASSASFASGEASAVDHVVQRDLDGGWRATIAQPAWPTGILASTSALTVLIAGIAASLALAVLILVLGNGRRRAMYLVARRTDELNHQATHDALTGLPNRTLILDRTEQLLARCRRNDTVAAAMYIDLDGFKDVNDSMGHEAGDQLLRAVTARLTSSLRGVDTIGRMGGDEFVVLVDGASLQIAPELVAERLLDVLRQPFELGLAARPVTVTASVGIAAGDRATASDLLRDADIALYRAKEGGRNRFEVFHPAMETAVQEQYELDTDLRSALRNDEFLLYFQPIYDLADLTVIGAEALIRWDHPTRGILLPGEFIPRLETSGQIVEVGRWVLNEACREAVAWHSRGSDLTVSVNLSARQLDSDGIVADVEDAIRRSGIDASRLILEITETTLMRNTELTARRLHVLKALGVSIAVDDFGTGYSSLAYLQQFPVDCLKIDRSFTDALARSAESDALARTLVQLGKDLGLVTLAEGIETPEQLDYLRGADVDRAQGFLFARPLAADDFDTLTNFSAAHADTRTGC